MALDVLKMIQNLAHRLRKRASISWVTRMEDAIRTYRKIHKKWGKTQKKVGLFNVNTSVCRLLVYLKDVLDKRYRAELSVFAEGVGSNTLAIDFVLDQVYEMVPLKQTGFCGFLKRVIKNYRKKNHTAKIETLFEYLFTTTKMEWARTALVIFK